MTTWLLTLNAGSSSLKFALFEELDGTPVVRAIGQIEELGATSHLILRSATDGVLEDQRSPDGGARDHEIALQHVLAVLARHFPQASIAAVGHRVVHGGPVYAAPIVVTDSVLAELEGFSPLAPLHQPHNLAGIDAAKAAFPDAVQVACFDTAFHRAHPWVNDAFALPRRYYDKGVRRYGFHGLSYAYVTRHLRETAPYHAAGRLVVAHLGSGASMCAIRDGQSIGSTMGFSALDGLPMGTRCGQLDPGVLLYLMDQEGLSSKEIADLLYKEFWSQGPFGPQQRYADPRGRRHARGPAGDRLFRIPGAAGAGRHDGDPQRHRRARILRRHWRERLAHPRAGLHGPGLARAGAR